LDEVKENVFISDFHFTGCCIVVFRKALMQLFGDESLQLATEGNRRCLTMANTLLQILLSNHSPDQNKILIDFSTGLVTGVAKIVEDVSGSSLNREKMWTNFHCLRSSREFRGKWETFLRALQMPTCPIFYQHVTANVMEQIIKQKLPVTNSSTSSQSTSLTYEEENAIRYVGGYVIKSVKATLKSPQDNELTLGLDELCNTDDDVEPAESEEWLCSIDRVD
jgi:hypothetical protein